jgi:hypothetical protein
MPHVDLLDETFVVASRQRIAALVHEPANWRRWWPDLALTVVEDRGPEGIRWSLDGPLRGSTELWIELHADGAIVHYYLRADLPGRAGSGRRAAREARRRAVAGKRVLWAIKDELETDREVGGA